MATYKARAIVLGRHNLGEADRIVAFYTLEHGQLRAVARGVRKVLSRQAGHIEPFSEVDLMLAEGRNLDIVTSARLIWYPKGMTGDLDRLQLAFLLTRMVERLTDVGHTGGAIYQLLRYCLRWIDEAGASAVAELFFKLRFLAELGYAPRLANCAVCGQVADLGYISAEPGGVVCAACHQPGDDKLSSNQLGLWRRLVSAGLEALAPGDDELAYASLAACDSLYQYNFSRRFSLAG